MKIDGVSVEPSPADDPYAMGPVALDIDCDLDALAQKMQLDLPAADYKTLFGGKIRSCFTGKDAVEWCIRKEFCSDVGDAVHLLNRMLRRGLMHHCSLNKLVENHAAAYYRFPQDHFKILIDQTGSHMSVRKRLRPSAKTLHGEAALQERWYADVPTLPVDKVRKLGQVLQRLTSRDVQRGLRRHHMVFQGKELVDVLIDSGVAKDVTDALALGNAFLRAGLFHHIRLKAPLRNDDTLYRLAKCQYDILVARDQVSGMSYVGPTGEFGMDESRLGTVTSNIELNDVLDTQGKSALELATASRYWTSYRASKLYVLNLYVMEGFIDMSEDWDSHVDQMFPSYCECYLTRDKEATTHSTICSAKTRHPEWNCPVAFVDVDYLDTVRIDLKAQTQLGNDHVIGSLEFAAHAVMGARGSSIVVEFDCGSQQFAECAAAIIKVQFDPAVAGPAVGSEGSKHHHLLMQGVRKQEELANAADMSRSRGPKNQMRRSMRGAVRRTSQGATAEDMDPVFINVEGCLGCVLLDDDSSSSRRLESFTGLPPGLVSHDGGLHGSSVSGSFRSSLHSLWDPEQGKGGAGGGAGGGHLGPGWGIGRRASYTSSDARRGSIQSDLPDIHEHNEFHGALPGTTNTNININNLPGSSSNNSSSSTSSSNTPESHGPEAMTKVPSSFSSGSVGNGYNADATGMRTINSGVPSQFEALRDSRGGTGAGIGGGVSGAVGGSGGANANGRMRRRTSWDPTLTRRGTGAGRGGGGGGVAGGVLGVVGGGAGGGGTGRGSGGGGGSGASGVSCGVGVAGGVGMAGSGTGATVVNGAGADGREGASGRGWGTTASSGAERRLTWGPTSTSAPAWSTPSRQ